MTKCYLDSVLFVDNGRVDDAVPLVMGPGVSVTSYDKKNCDTSVIIRENLILLRKTFLNNLRTF